MPESGLARGAAGAPVTGTAEEWRAGGSRAGRHTAGGRHRPPAARVQRYAQTSAVARSAVERSATVPGSTVPERSPCVSGSSTNARAGQGRGRRTCWQAKERSLDPVEHEGYTVQGWALRPVGVARPESVRCGGYDAWNGVSLQNAVPAPAGRPGRSSKASSAPAHGTSAPPVGPGAAGRSNEAPDGKGVNRCAP